MNGIDTLVAGDTLEFLTTVNLYPPGDGWTLKFRLVPRVSGGAITVTATTSGLDYSVQVAPSTTTNWAAGMYAWTSWVEKSGARHVIQTGQVEIKADPASSSAPQDTRTHARKVLDAINAVIEGRATKDQEEYTIGNRMLKRTPLMTLCEFRQQYQAQVRSEDLKAAAAAGLGGGKVVVRL